MQANHKPYTKTLNDEFDWKLIDQLHAAVSQISSFCFETKKFCVTTEFVVLTLLANFTKSKLDHSLFVAGILIPISFWLLDSVAYYYQVKLRGMMSAIRKNIEERHQEQLSIPQTSLSVISAKRVEQPIVRRVWSSAVNHSMWIYVFLVVSDLAAWGLFVEGYLK